MTLLFHQTEFNFSLEAKSWIIARYSSHFNENFFHNLDGSQVKFQHEWRDSLAGQELLNFLSQYVNDTSDLIITAHLCNTKVKSMGLPHIDYARPNGVDRELIATRFNVMVLGNPEDIMYWWTEFDDLHPALTETTLITARTNRSYPAKTMPGKNTQEKLEYLGKATGKAENLLTPSAFVRTDCVHAICTSPGPRLVVTVGFRQKINEIVNLLAVDKS